MSQQKHRTGHHENPARFQTQEQRLRETKLREWYLQMVLEDRAETALPPVELWDCSCTTH